MDLVASGLDVAMVVAVGLVLAWLGKDRFRAIDARLDRLESRLDARIDRLDVRFDRLDDRVAELRADVTQIALAVGARPRATNG